MAAEAVDEEAAEGAEIEVEDQLAGSPRPDRRLVDALPQELPGQGLAGGRGPAAAPGLGEGGGGFWVFFGALSNVEYAITVTDSETGTQRSYVNPAGVFASVADTSAFPPDGLAAPPVTGDLESRGGMLAFPAGLENESSPTVGTCVPSATVLCLRDSRFKVEVEWDNGRGGSGDGQAQPLTSDTGWFWFFRQTNVELMLKVLDGRVVNGNYWVFFGALSNVHYTIRVTDTVTGQMKTYENPAGRLASVGDTEAFPPPQP